MMMSHLYAEVVILGTALDRCLHYSVPPQLADRVRPGSIARVELGKRQATAIVVSVGSTAPELPEKIRIRSLLDIRDDFAVPPDLLQLSKWIARYYFYPLGEVLSLAVPYGGLPGSGRLKPPGIRTVRLVADRFPAAKKFSERETAIIRLLENSGGAIPLKTLKEECKGADYALRKMTKNGLIAIEEVAAPESACPAPKLAAPFELTADQKNALDEILPTVGEASFQPFVLYGVTGSGKTEIYLRLVQEALTSGKGAVILVPEIALSTQMEAIFHERFGPVLAVWHSALSERERRLQWFDIHSGCRRIVLGARSAVLSPIKDLGLVIVDEEHDTAYKQEDHLRYNARDVALMRGKILGVPVVMGSATPSLQTVSLVNRNTYRAVLLPSRVLDRPLPEFEIVDMRREGPRSGIFSYKLREAITETIRNGNQVLLFLNRRGFAKHYVCNACGHVLECASCSVSLTYHKGDNLLRCHYCGWERALVERCPSCGHAALVAHGFGTERVEKEAKKLFPDAKIVRVDRDTMSNHEKLVQALDAVRSGRADILLGTQMVAKGHDFPELTLVGIINADVGLQVPDFRAGETLVQLLLQVAGRAGRGEAPGKVILQTYNPFHFTIESALKMDYDGFCEKELESRKTLQYPPFARLLKLLVTAGTDVAARDGARMLASVCREKADAFRTDGKQIAILGPAPAAYVKLKNRFRWQIFIKTWTSSDMQNFVESVLSAVKSDPTFRPVQITVDRDPATEI